MKPVDCSLPETMLAVAPGAEAGIPIDAITAAVARADAVLWLLVSQFDDSGADRYSDDIIMGSLWAVQGMLREIKTLAMHGYDTTWRPGSMGDAR